MCFGAAYIASNSSESFKVKKIFLTQVIPDALTIRISKLQPDAPEDEDVNYEKVARLFRRGDILGLKKSLSLTYDQDMRIELFRGDKEPETDAVDHLELLTTFELAGIGALKENSVAKKEGSSKPKVSLSFEMTRSGFVELSKVEAKIDELVTYNETVKVPKVDAGEPSGEEAAPMAAEAASSEEAAGEAQSGSEGEQAESQATEETEQKPKEPEYVEEIVTKTKTSPHTFPIRKVTVLHRDSRQLSEEQKQAARKRVRAFDSRDQMKFKTDEAKNNFEAICYSFRDWLQSEENLPFVGETRQEELI